MKGQEEQRVVTQVDIETSSADRGFSEDYVKTGVNRMEGSRGSLREADLMEGCCNSVYTEKSEGDVVF